MSALNVSVIYLKFRYLYLKEMHQFICSSVSKKGLTTVKTDLYFAAERFCSLEDISEEPFLFSAGDWVVVDIL